MKYTRSLRYRITLSFFLFGLTLAVAIAGGVKFVVEDIEEKLLEETMRLEHGYFVTRFKEDPNTPLLNTATLSTFIVDVGQEHALPPFLRGLQPGIFEISDQDRHYQVVVDSFAGKRLVLLRDITPFEERESAIFLALGLMVVGASVVALWAGYGLGNKVIAPVSNLARAVATLKPDKPMDPISPQYAHDEVGELAQAFDHYLARLRDFIEREQEFTADASHELRTPLAVINGAVELLSADAALSERAQRVLQRIARAGKDMSQVVESLLFLAREQGGLEPRASAEPARVVEVVDEAIQDARHLLAGKPVAVSTQVNADIQLDIPKSTLAIVVGNLLRNAFAYTREGEVKVIVDENSIEVCDTGAGIDQEDLPHVFERHYRGGQTDAYGSGLGLSIVKRICERNRWRVAIDSASGRGTRIVIHLKA